MIIAIDFGTSNTVVSTLDPVTQTPRTLRFNEISRLFETPGGSVSVVPTLVYVQKDRIAFGEMVRSQRLSSSQPERFFQSFKRDLAADFQPPPRQIDGNSYSAEYVSELFLKEIWQQLSSAQINPDRVIFTVPVGAFERYLDWFRDVGERLGVPEVQIVDESTAAALGYAVKRPGSLVLVVDFGGGTLDLSLVRTAAASGGKKVLKAEVIAKSDAYIGGVDIDAWIVEHYLRKIDSSREEIKEIGWQNLLEIAERLKIQLSNAPEAQESWFDDENFIAHDLSLNRDELEEILENQQLLAQLREALDEVLAIAYSKGVAKSDIELVAMVGGSCLIPAVQQLIISYFGKSRVQVGKPFEAIAHGALTLPQIVEVEDYLRHGYAIRLWEPQIKTYSYLPLFEKGSKYPCKSDESLTLQTAIDGQREIRLDIGEVADISQAEVTFDARGRMTSSHLQHQSQYRSLESHHEQVCVAHLDPPGRTGIDRVEVSFEVNEGRILLATVKDLLTGKVLVERGAIAKLQ
ncbi:Hsp70 family protein [Microseira wollei]|uniref:Heat shock protein 70 n=1 Tax=Microseira wollei NIES-4236 TaxID=2530354 RepID=A0AAV3X1I7_9CYAN|nr:Hsp70 family protein [Microseira wollei]GET35869.1 heat shock protein 70 [Microseira wollei NIES-4236]